LAAILLLELSTFAKGVLAIAGPRLLALGTRLVERLLVLLPQGLRHPGRHGRVLMWPASRGFQLMRGRGLEGSELFAELGFAELAADERRLDPHTPIEVLEDQPIPMWPKHDAKTAADIMYVVPASQLGARRAGRRFSRAQRAKLSIPWWASQSAALCGTFARSRALERSGVSPSSISRARAPLKSFR
jgi:hypothetical protein